MESVRIAQVDKGLAAALLRFYEQLSPASIRTFHPLGEHTTLDACEAIVRENLTRADTGRTKFDLVALDDTRILGWSFLWGLDTEEPLFGLAVADDFHGKGLGTRLMDSVLEAARAMGVKRIVLTVVGDNERAWAMYRRRGFTVSEEFTGEDGLDYFRMRLELGSPLPSQEA